MKKFIIDNGTTFQNSFVTTSVCCPTRATFLTGQYSHNHNVLSNELADGGLLNLNDKSTLAVWLHNSGYITGLIGKYLNSYGFDSTASTLNPLNPKYIPPGWDTWNVLLSHGMYEYKMNINGQTFEFGSNPEDYQTDVLSNLSVDFIDKAELSDDQPFFYG